MSILDELDARQDQTNSEPTPAAEEVKQEEPEKVEEPQAPTPEAEPGKPDQPAEQVKPAEDVDPLLDPSNFGEHNWALQVSKKFKKQAREAQAELSEREKRIQELEARVKAQEDAKTEQEFLEDPAGKAKELAKKIAAEELVNYKIETSQQDLYQKIGPEEYQEFFDIWKELCESEPELQEKMTQALRPAQWAYDTVQSHKAMSKYKGLSIQEIEQKVIEDYKASQKKQESSPKQEDGAPGITPMPNFTETPAGGSKSTDGDNPPSLAELYKW